MCEATDFINNLMAFLTIFDEVAFETICHGDMTFDNQVFEVGIFTQSFVSIGSVIRTSVTKTYNMSCYTILLNPYSPAIVEVSMVSHGKAIDILHTTILLRYIPVLNHIIR